MHQAPKAARHFKIERGVLHEDSLVENKNDADR